jgi:hypothetical protein
MKLISRGAGMSEKHSTPKTSRRRFFAGAATAGVAAAAVSTLPQLAPTASTARALPDAPENGGGYSLSEHVKRYYKTARV